MIPSKTYRLMIYFAHSTLVIYSKDIYSHERMTVEEFRQHNPEVVKRVFDEGLSIMQYELSHNQMSKAILVYLQSKYKPASVEDTEAYQIK